MNKEFIKSFNKIIPEKEEHFKKINNLEKCYSKIKGKTVYTKKIDFIWNTLSKDGIIILNSKNINFIEKDFEGNYIDYLEFIIPRISKLNKNMLEIFIDNSDDDYESFNSVDFIDTEENVSEKSLDYDENYINLLEYNINELQSKVQNIIDDLLPKINRKNDRVFQIENKINQIEELLNSCQQTVNENKEDQDKKINYITKKLSDHEKFTKNSFNIIEQRINKLIDVLNYKV